ncbi:hypothetical protein T484DRAFT_1796724, partial [Baffinella frigidus]
SNVNIHSAFDALDANKDGFLEAEELHSAFTEMGLGLSRSRCARYLNAMDLDGDGKVNYREFIRKVSRVDMSAAERQRWDEAGQQEAKIREKLRERFDDAKQAFHFLDADADGRLGRQEFAAGLRNLALIPETAAGPTGQGEERWLDMLFDRSDSNGDGFIKYLNP